MRVPVPVPYADFGNPQSLNQYAYVGGNPASKADPDGHCCDLPSWSDVGQFIAGVANAYGSDNLLGAGRVESGNLGYKMGQVVGDGAATVSGVVETGVGLGGEGVGIALDATGVGAIAGVPINVASAGLIAHGVTTGVEGGAHLAQDASQSSAKPAYENTPENQGRMQEGKAPIGNDGKSVELHHDGQTQNGPVKEMTQTDHRGGDNFAKNHSNTGQQPSQIDRKAAAKTRREHWKNKTNEKEK